MVVGLVIESLLPVFIVFYVVIGLSFSQSMSLELELLLLVCIQIQRIILFHQSIVVCVVRLDWVRLASIDVLFRLFFL